jgi:hypothetical protein
MTKQENDPNQTNSLLRTATRLGASKTAMTAMRSNSRPPIQKVRVMSSNESRMSELSTPVDEEMRPAMVKEVAKKGGVDVGNSIIDGSTKSRESSKPLTKTFNGPNFKSKINFGIGAALRVTPQPANFPTKLMKLTNGAKKSTEIQKGIVISAPSPISLGRVQVQLGQERVLPESKEFREQQERARREKERAMKEAQYQKAKENVKRQLQSEVDKEMGEGFETQLEDFDPATGVGNEKMLYQQIIEGIRPNMDTPSHVAEARFLARKALHASKKAGTKTSGQGLPMIPDGSPKHFPVSEIYQKDDGSISTIGNPQLRASRVYRHQIDNTNALIDQIDSATVGEDGTEAAMERAMNGGCEVNNGKMKGVMTSAIGCSMGADFLGTLMGQNTTRATSTEGTKRNEIIDADAVFLDREVKNRLNRMVEESDAPLDSASPRSNHSMPNLEDEEVIDLTKSLAISRMDKDLNGKRQRANGLLNVDADNDRYAVEGDESPRKKKSGLPQSMGGNKGTTSREAELQDDKSSVASSADLESHGLGSSNISCTDFDPSPGVICGAVPLYFLFSTKTRQVETDETHLVSKIAASPKVTELQKEVFNEDTEPINAEQLKSPGIGKAEKSERNGRRDKVMLDKDDAYWDTLSTIASTRGLDYEKFAPAPATPTSGPIPIEITTNKESDEGKITSSSKGNKAKAPKSMKKLESNIDGGEGDQSLSYSHATADNDKRGQTKSTRTTQVTNKAPLKPASKLIHPVSSLQKQQIPTKSNDSLEESSELLLAITRSESGEAPIKSTTKSMTDTAHKNSQERSVTWGFEEIYEAQGSEFPRMAVTQEQSSTMDYQEEQQLLSRTLQLSKDLLASLAQEDLDEADDEIVKSLLSLSLETEEDSQTRLSFTGQTGPTVVTANQRFVAAATSHESPIDVEKMSHESPIDVEKLFSDYDTVAYDLIENIDYDQESGSTSNRSPEILSKLDVLRSQRAAALARFQSSRTSTAIEKSAHPESRVRNHLKFYQGSKTLHMQEDQHDIINLDGRDDIESESSKSGESSRTTPSKKARELRRQLDEALHASREIRKSQQNLGNDLQTFKSRFSQKNGELEDQAIRAMRTSAVHQQ